MFFVWEGVCVCVCVLMTCLGGWYWRQRGRRKRMKRFSWLWVGPGLCKVPCVSCQLCALFHLLESSGHCVFYNMDHFSSMVTKPTGATNCKLSKCKVNSASVKCAVIQCGAEVGLVGCVRHEMLEAKPLTIHPSTSLGLQHGVTVKQIQVSSL